uniref:Uncharacterized protein n=1 Tax=Trichogramma kaykai TaxID=54128 RepID=A0ABD2VY62_9HYME
MISVGPFNVDHKDGKKPFYYRDLDTCTHVFKIINVKRGSMVRPYTGPHRVIHRDPSRKNFDIDINGEQVKVSAEHLKPAFTTLNELPGFENWSPLQPPDDGNDDDVQLDGENFVVGDGMDLIQLDDRDIERVPLNERGLGRGVSGGVKNPVFRREDVPQHLLEHILREDLSVPRDPGSKDNRSDRTPPSHESSGSRRNSDTHSAPEAHENHDLISKLINNPTKDNSNNSNQDGFPNFIALPPTILADRQGEVVVDGVDYSIPSDILNYDKMMIDPQSPHSHMNSRKRKNIDPSDDVSSPKKRK